MLDLEVDGSAGSFSIPVAADLSGERRLILGRMDAVLLAKSFHFLVRRRFQQFHRFGQIAFCDRSRPLSRCAADSEPSCQSRCLLKSEDVGMTRIASGLEDFERPLGCTPTVVEIVLAGDYATGVRFRQVDLQTLAVEVVEITQLLPLASLGLGLENGTGLILSDHAWPGILVPVANLHCSVEECSEDSSRPDTRGVNERFERDRSVVWHSFFSLLNMSGNLSLKLERFR